MASKFLVPKCLEDLMELPIDDEDVLYAQDVIDIHSLDASEMHQLITGVATELAVKDVWCVQEQSLFDQLFSLVRGYDYLEVSQRSVFIDSLWTNFVQLNVKTSVLISLINDPYEDLEDVTVQAKAQSNAIKIYTYFLCCILLAEEAKPESSSGKTSGKTSGKSGGKSRGSKGPWRKKHVPDDWDWNSLRSRCLGVLAGALQNDLQKIFGSPHLDQSLVAFLAKAAFKLLENRSVVEKVDCKQPLCQIISACTVQFRYGISSVVTIVDMLHKFKHLPTHMADLVSLAVNQYNGSSFAVELLREIGKIDPENFERDNAGAENVGLFLEELAARLPKIIMTNLSVILCHLDGKCYKIRNSLVKVVGRLLVEAINNTDGTSTNDVTRLRTEQRLLNILIERSRDISAHTRKHVLQTWAYLCKERAVPLGHWNLVSDLAAGRLEDNAAIVRKNALQLLATLLQHNPFGGSLRAAAFEATHEKFSGQLSDMSPCNNTPGMGEEGERSFQDKELHFSAEQVNEEMTESSEGGPLTPGLEGTCSQPENSGPQAHQATPDPQFSREIGGLESTRALVASLESGLRFSKIIGSTMDTLSQLLASSTIGDVESTIELLILCKEFEIDGSGPCLRKTLPLVFSPERGIRFAVVKAFKTLYLESPNRKITTAEVASNLINLTREACLGDLASIEELVVESMSAREISAGTISSLWDFFTFNAQGSTADRCRAALTVLCMAAKSTPQILSTHLQNILDIGFGRWAKDDVLLARSACIALQRLPVKDRAGFRSGHKIFSILSNLIVRPGLSEACWYSASEQAINAIYALHPAPENFSIGLLVKLAQSVFTSSQGTPSSDLDTEDNDGDIGEQSHDFSSVSAVGASRFLFAVAHVALQHLVYIGSCLKLVRQKRNDNNDVSTTRASEESLADVGSVPAKDENIAAELGLAASEDTKLDDLGEKVESEIVGGDKTHPFLVGAIAPMVSRLCSNSTLMHQNQHLRSSALLALCKLMVIDANFCEQHLQILFTVAQNSLDESVRSNCVIALGDLALRFPNLVEPWMESIYARVHDKSTTVRKNAVLVLSHLILNDLIKVKGYISEMAMHLEDEDSRISDLVKLFFHELSKKGNNPINNLLPDILSRLSSNPALSQDKFNLVMQFLISTIKKNKQMEGLIDKFCNRFVGTSDARQWQDITYCLSQFSYSQSCLKKLADNFKRYQHALGDTEVVGHFKSLIAKTRKLAAADVKLLLEEIEESIMNCHNQKMEQEEATRKAQEHNQWQKKQEELMLAESLGELNLDRHASQGHESETKAEPRVFNLQQQDAKSRETPPIVPLKAKRTEEDGSTRIRNNVVEGDGLNLGRSALQDDELETRTQEEARVSNLQQWEAEEMDTPTIVTVKEEQIASIKIHNNFIAEEGFDFGRTASQGEESETRSQREARVLNPQQWEAGDADTTTSTSGKVEQCMHRHGARGTVKTGNSGAPNGIQNVDLGISGELLADSEAQTGLLIHEFSSMRFSERKNSEEDTAGTQPYPYMDLNLESASAPDVPESAIGHNAVHVKQERGLENDDIQYDVKENPYAGDYIRDCNETPSSPFIPAPPSLESPQPAKTSRRRKLRKVGYKVQDPVKSFPAVKEEHSPLPERVSGQTRVLQPLNDMG